MVRIPAKQLEKEKEDNKKKEGNKKKKTTKRLVVSKMQHTHALHTTHTIHSTYTLQKKIDNLKKCNGQLDFEKFIHSRNTMSSINHMGEITLRVNNIEISLPKISNQEKYYKNML